MIEYKVVKETDNARILQLYRLAGWWEMDDNPAYLETVAGIISNTFCFVIAEQEGEILGMGRAISDGYSDAYIQDVTVDPIHRGKGIGKGIIRCLVGFLQEKKIQWIGLISEPGYERFYQSLGFDVMPSYTPFLLDQTKKENV
ncbi:MAG TPA: GNAT family N-acetyltransferase [Candidatus Cloacimonadota bacterium]|nr:GNAT family N-acetyltransferase [Candidatus Cloacimonadota bacterium]